MTSSENTTTPISVPKVITTINSRKRRKSVLKTENKPLKDSSTFYCSEHASLFPFERRDIFGNLIAKGGHSHKVTFIDEIYETDFAEVLDNKRQPGVFQIERKFFIYRPRRLMSTPSNCDNNTTTPIEKKKEKEEVIKCQSCVIF